MEIVNKIEAVKYMLKNKSYVPELNTNKQDAWLLYYLRKKKKYNKDKAYKIWLPIYETVNAKSFKNEYQGIFWHKWSTSAITVRFNKQDTAIIYQKEIDKINECDLKTIWQKQLLLLMLVYSKMSGNFRLSEINLGLFAKYINKPTKDITENLSYQMTNEAMRVGLLEKVDVKEWDEIEGVWDDSRYFNVHEFADGKVVAKIWNGYQVKELTNLFPMTKRCQNCGNQFIIGGYTKRDICDCCYNKKRKDVINKNAIKYYRNQKFYTGNPVSLMSKEIENSKSE